ncbi:MAG: hypothetical protein HC882_01730, partial [Acidobacteria bacterium]|nr:hypothetical protein [Acidobacteriota bacterium]
MNAERGADLERIRAALTLAESVLAAFTPDTMSVRLKSGDDPVTDADLASITRCA